MNDQSVVSLMDKATQGNSYYFQSSTNVNVPVVIGRWQLYIIRLIISRPMFPTTRTSSHPLLSEVND